MGMYGEEEGLGVNFNENGYEVGKGVANASNITVVDSIRLFMIM